MVWCKMSMMCKWMLRQVIRIFAKNGGILILGCEKNFPNGDAVIGGPGDSGGLVLESVKIPTTTGRQKALTLSGQQDSCDFNAQMVLL